MIIVEISCPALDSKYDFQLDENAQTGRLIAEVCEILCKKSKSIMPEATENFVLADYDTQNLLDADRTLLENHVHEGSRLLLV